jgi:hypothetical protein
MADRTGTPPGPPAGWYNDPRGHDALRWWDGSRWGEQTQAQPGYEIQQPQREYGYAPADHGQPPRRKRRRVFMWVFLAIQALFVLWLVVGLATVHAGPTSSQIAQQCYHHNWWPLFKSQADCVTHFGGAMTTAGNLGKGIGAALIILLWAVVDIILGISYGVYRLATRSR